MKKTIKILLAVTLAIICSFVNIPYIAKANSEIHIVEDTPNNTSLPIHFHCKAGIGRTTTFMIMYDIIKNYQHISLNDIIKRQVVLSKMDEKNSQDFYTGEHFKFLEKFYNSYTAKLNIIPSHNILSDKLYR